MKKNKRTSLHAKILTIVFFSFYFFSQILQFETTKTFQGERETEHKSANTKFYTSILMYIDIVTVTCIIHVPWLFYTGYWQ